jgi:hypothetical protein
MKLRTFGLSMILLGLGLSVQAQQSQSLYSHFDKTVGLKNLGINNGPIHLNPFRSYDQSHRYYVADKYIPGEVVYDGQPYANENIKYDIFKDIVVAKINDPNNAFGINLINAKTEYFILNNKKFVNLDLLSKKPDFVKGYYEAYKTDAKVALYTKYRKDQIEVLTNDGLFYKYQNANDFVFAYNDNFYKVYDERELVKIFPAYEKTIRDYAYVNRDLLGSDKVQFMKIMADYVNNLLQKDTK